MLTVAIIGAGGTGAAAARFLARAGHSVTVYEQFTLDHDRGSSYGGSRIIRRTYPDPLYTRMMASAYDLWRDLEAESGEELLARCGGLTFGREDNPAMAQTEQALQVNGVPYERLSSEEIKTRFPSFRLEQEQYGVYQADSGFLRASECVKAQMRLAVQAGAQLSERSPVRRFSVFSNGQIQIDADGQEARYDRVLVTVGPWMSVLLPSLRLPLSVTRQYYAHLQASEPVTAFGVGQFPIWIDADTNFYGFPHQPGLPGVKIACHEHGQSTDPDHVVRESSVDDLRPLLTYTERRLPALHGPPLYEKVCLYTNTPDEDFILDADPGLPGAFLCSGCSGHGFKFTVLLGHILAELVQGRQVTHDLTRFRLARFPGSSFQ